MHKRAGRSRGKEEGEGGIESDAVRGCEGEGVRGCDGGGDGACVCVEGRKGVRWAWDGLTLLEVGEREIRISERGALGVAREEANAAKVCVVKVALLHDGLDVI